MPIRLRRSPEHSPTRTSAKSPAERLWELVPGWLGAGSSRRTAAAALLAPRKLERRRLLDGAAPAATLEWLDGGDYVQASAASPDLCQSLADALAAANASPSDVRLSPMADRFEGETATLELTFSDPDALDEHTVEVDWADGSPLEAFSLPIGARSFTAAHKYLDDPAGTASDVFAVRARVIDASGESALGETALNVRNVAPSNLQIATIAPVDENGFAQFDLTFDDPGAADVHAVEVNWGDGSAIETFVLASGARALTATHQYSDDLPSGTSSDEFSVDVRLLDDDAGTTTAQSTATVRNVSPSNLALLAPATIDENGLATLEIKFDDPGLSDVHTLQIDWGDGSALDEVTLPAGARSFTAAHRYLDDDPSATSSDMYRIAVQAADDDGGVINGVTFITVENVAPSGAAINPLAPIVENDFALLTGAFVDPGVFDSHRLEVDWGDGSAVEVLPIAAGSRTFAAMHRYLDDGEPGPPTAEYLVTVRVRDDDGGVSPATTSQITVRNVRPLDVTIHPAAAAIDEGESVFLEISFVDPGSLDSHAYEIDWGDGHVTVGVPASSSFLVDHVYADDGNYIVRALVTDSDGGAGAATGNITVHNVAPTLSVIGDQVVNEGQLLSIANLGALSDPGFDNPLNAGNAINGGETVESFVFQIDWGDGRPPTSGAVTNRLSGRPGTPTIGSFDGAHTYADNGVYLVTASLFDDDGGVSQRSFRVTVLNVDPTLRGETPSPSVLEGQAFTLASLGVRIQDPGFDNPLNADEKTEFFIGADVDWGDGTPASPLTTTARISGGPGGVFTTAELVHEPHTYADDGSYIVTVRVQDDDGSIVARTLTIVVQNVAPTLTLTTRQFVLNEGDTLSIANLGTFTDPGFDNLANAGNAANGGEFEETFTYAIDWGDGTIETGQLPASRTSGSPGTPTTGGIGDSHRYLDNDSDNKYTITVTLSDDDGGVDVKSIEVTVFNVNPTLNPVAATDVTAEGLTTLQLSFSDPGADAFEVLVDWGDKLHLPPDERFVVETAYAGPTPQAFTLTHQYQGPPDPLHPAADITIRVKIRDDDFGAPLVVTAGESNVEDVTIGNPGATEKLVRIDTSPKVPMLSFPERPASGVAVAASEVTFDAISNVEINGSSGESVVGRQRFFELVIIRPDGTEGERFTLPGNVLSNLAALFRNLPDNHYAIYLVQAETNVRRLVIDVYVRNGRLIDPGDDSEGARDRPPTEESSTPAVDQPASPAPDSAIGAADESRPLAASSRPGALVNPRHEAMLASVALAMAAAGSSRRSQVDEALASASHVQRRRLRLVGHWQGRKPR